MRVNVYAEEMTDRVEVVEKVINGQTFTGLRIYLYMPVTRVKEQPDHISKVEVEQVQGPFIHHEGDDDSSAVTFWGKADLRDVLVKALDLLNHHYEGSRNNIVK